MAIRRLGQVLVDLKFIDREQLQMLLTEQGQRRGELLGKIAIEMELISDDQLAVALAEQMNLKAVNLADMTVAPEVLNLVTEPMRSCTGSFPSTSRTTA